MPLTILTGGQSGVDEGAAEGAWTYCTEHLIRNNAAKPLSRTDSKVDWKCVLPHGYKRESPMPAWMRENKNRKVFAIGYKEYDERTNVVTDMADAVLLISEPGKITPGTKLTLGFAKRKGKQIWRFRNVANRAVHRAESHAIAYWLRSIESFMGKDRKEHGLNLMVAGPRASKWADGSKLAHLITKAICEAYERDIHVQPSRS